MVLMLSVHPSRMGDLRSEHAMRFSRPVRQRDYLDTFGNLCTRLVAPTGLLRDLEPLVLFDSGLPDDAAPGARQINVDQLPDETLVFLLGSRYCDTQKLTDLAWSQFGGVEGGMAESAGDLRLRARPSRVRLPARARRPDGLRGTSGASRRLRDFAHLAVALCRCMNIPARYCTGYLGDIGVHAIRHRWTSALGSKLFSTDAGTRSMRATITPGSDAS